MVECRGQGSEKSRPERHRLLEPRLGSGWEIEYYESNVESFSSPSQHTLQSRSLLCCHLDGGFKLTHFFDNINCILRFYSGLWKTMLEDRSDKLGQGGVKTLIA